MRSATQQWIPMYFVVPSSEGYSATAICMAVVSTSSTCINAP